MRELLVANYNNTGYLVDGEYAIPLPNGFLLQSAYLKSSNYEVPVGGLRSHLGDINLLFVCFDIDPNRRIKKGQFFLADADGNQPLRVYKKIREHQVLSLRKTFDDTQIEARKFKPYEPTRFFNVAETCVCFGNDRIKTKWRILSVEPVVGYEEYYVLQEIVGVGAVPHLREELLPEHYLEEVKREFMSLVNELSSSPESIIDHCRDLATSTLSAYIGLLPTERKDLGSLISQLPSDLVLIRSLATVVNRFHPRRKPNEKERMNLSTLGAREAELAVHSVFQILKELNWTHE